MAGGICTSLALETAMLRTQGFSWRTALSTATNMSMLSMCAMELTESVVAMQWMNGPFNPSIAMHWAGLVPAMAAGFAAPLPYNYFQLKRYGRSCH